MKNNFSLYLCGFRKSHNAPYSLFTMIENWKKQLDNGEKVEVIFTDLSKDFDTINHSILMAKLKAYGFSNQVLSLLQSYLCSRFRRSIINSYFSSWNDVITGVPLGSILGLLLFKIFLNDIFCLFRNVNYVTMSRKNMGKIKIDLEMDFTILHKWFYENHMVLNPGKCHYIVIGDDDPSYKTILNNNEIATSNEVKLLGILLDSKLNFDSHIISLCKNAPQKLSALARID